MKYLLSLLLLCASINAQKVTNLTQHNGVCVIDWYGQPAWVIVAWSYTTSAPSINIAKFQIPSAQYANSKLVPVALGAIETRANCPQTQFVTYASDGTSPYWFSHGALTNGQLIRDWGGTIPVATDMKWIPPALGPATPTTYSLMYLPSQFGPPCGGGAGYLAPELMIMICRYDIGS